MFCKKCGTEITREDHICTNCSYDNTPKESQEAVTPVVDVTPATPAASTTSAAAPAPAVGNLQNNGNKIDTKRLSNWCWGAIASLMCGAFTLLMGLNKLLRYESGESYPYEAVNAYVGGDAYNYIINGNYATAYFVLTMMFVLAAIGMMILHYMSKES